MSRLFVILILAAGLIGWSFSVDKTVSTDNFRVRGSFKSNNSNKVEIKVHDLQTKKTRSIDYFKNKFDFSVPVNGCFILTLSDGKKGKSIFINTMLKTDLEKRQNFIVIVDLTSKTLSIGDQPYVEKCSGVIKYSKKMEKFYYARKELTIQEINALVAEELQSKK